VYSRCLATRQERLLREAGDAEGETWTTVGPVEALYDQRRGEFDGVWLRSRLSRMARGLKVRAFTLTFTLRCTNAEGRLGRESCQEQEILAKPAGWLWQILLLVDYNSIAASEVREERMDTRRGEGEWFRTRPAMAGVHDWHACALDPLR
jgi:hypothetical protein